MDFELGPILPPEPTPARPRSGRGGSRQTLVLGMGTGRCGTHSLARLLNRQADASVTHEQRPLLSWRRDEGRSAIRERLARFRRNRPAGLIGDVASFYLPYIEEALEVEPELRVVCLERPCEEVVASFERWLDSVHPLPTNHWSARPGPGWHHEPVWTRVFPQYEVDERAEGIRRYWHDYHTQADALARAHPGNVRIFPTQSLNSEEGVRGLLDFAGIAAAAQVVLTNVRGAATNAEHTPLHPRRRELAGAGHLDPRRCLVLVATGRGSSAGEAALPELERRGYSVRRADRLPCDAWRSQVATDALLHGYEETLWVEPQIRFDPDDVERLRALEEPLVAAIAEPATTLTLTDGIAPAPPGGGQVGPELVEVFDAPAGLLLVRRAVYLDLQRHLDLPLCNDQFGRALIPFFQPTSRPWHEGWWYRSGLEAFCDAARRCGYRLLADASICLRR